jgi:pyridoxal phosphate enzyme (YggS family)
VDGPEHDAADRQDPFDIADSLAVTRLRIEAACRRSGRESGDVRLIGVTKMVAPDRIEAARAAGLSDFGENYANELVAKARRISATWHFIGTLQRGTAHRVAEVADVVHTAEPGHGLERLARRARERGRTLPCLIQVDLVGGRHGVAADRVAAFAEAAQRITGIRIVGLMTLPPWSPDPAGTRPWFAQLRELRDRLAPDAPWLRELSMGMSADFEVAIEEGATMVRVGTALFGARRGPNASHGPRERKGM